MKILFQCPKYLPSLGGIEVGTHTLAKQLIKKGHDIFVLCQNYDGGKSYEIIDGVKVYRYPAPKFHPIFKIWSFSIQQKNIEKFLGYFLKKNKFDLVVPRYFFFVKPTKKISPETRIAYLQPSIAYLALKKMMNNTKNILDKFVYFFRYKNTVHMEKEAVELSDIVFSRSSAMDRIDKEKFGIPEDKIFRYTQAINLEKYKPMNLSNMRKKLGIEKTKNLITVSRLTPDKNNLGLIRMFAMIKSDDFRLVIVGDGPERNVLEREAKKLKVKDRVLFLGEKKNPEKFYNLGDVFVLASTQEGFGTVFTEAISCGLPIIGFDSDYPENITAVKDIIGDSLCGFAVKNNKEMAEKIKEILSDKEILDKMSKNAIKRSKDYVEDKIAGEFLEVINSNK